MPEEMGGIVTWQLGIRTTIIQAEKRELDEGLTSGNPQSNCGHIKHVTMTDVFTVTQATSTSN